MLGCLIIAACYVAVALLMMLFTYPEVLLRWVKGLGRLLTKGGKSLAKLVGVGAKRIAKEAQHAQWHLFGRAPHRKIKKVKSETL